MAWISVAEAKAHLNKSASSTTDDAELQGFVDAACAAIGDVMGHVDLTSFTWTGHASLFIDEHRRGYTWQWNRLRHVIDLPESPVLAVSAVSLLDGAGGSTAVPAGDPASGVSGWWLEDTVLHLTDRGQYQVAYTAGRDPVPGNYRLAALELTAHLWRGSQLNQNSGRPPVGGDQMMVLPHMASAMPYRVRELLGLYGEVRNAHVVIA